MVKEEQQKKDQQSCMFVFVACLAIPSSNWGHQPRGDNSIPYMDVWKIYKDTEQSQDSGERSFIERIKAPVSWR